MISPTVSIDPASDVIADVIRAADPGRSAAAARRLSDLAGQASAPKPSFDSELGRLAAPVQATAMRAGVRARAAADSKSGSQTAFEAMFLGNVLGELLPTDAGGYFGEGTAGQMWKSMLADQVARQIAKSGAFDIAGRLFARSGHEGVEATPQSKHGARALGAIGAPAALEYEIAPARTQG